MLKMILHISTNADLLSIIVRSGKVTRKKRTEI